MDNIEEFILLDTLKGKLAWVRWNKLELEYLEPLRKELEGRINKQLKDAEERRNHD